jgi:hypothetical protein
VAAAPPCIPSHPFAFLCDRNEGKRQPHVRATQCPRLQLHVPVTLHRLFVRKPIWAALRCAFMSQHRLQSLYSPVKKAERRGDEHMSISRAL